MSNETKWTPGPWRIGHYGPNGCYTVGTAGGLMTAMVAHSVNHEDQRERAIGDAHLIAAAPLMHLSLANRSLLCDDDFEDIVAAIEEGDSEKLCDLWERVQAKARKV